MNLNQYKWQGVKQQNVVPMLYLKIKKAKIFILTFFVPKAGIEPARL